MARYDIDEQGTAERHAASEAGDRDVTCSIPSESATRGHVARYGNDDQSVATAVDGNSNECAERPRCGCGADAAVAQGCAVRNLHFSPTWNVAVGSPVFASPLLTKRSSQHEDSGGVVVAAAKGRVCLLRATDGQTVWEFQAGGPVFSSPQVR